MNYDQDYEVFEKWFSENELRFAHGQFSDKQIAYSAWLAGRGAVEQCVQRTGLVCTCRISILSYRDTRSICGFCGKPRR